MHWQADSYCWATKEALYEHWAAFIFLKNIYLFIFIFVCTGSCCVGFSLVAERGDHSLVVVPRLLLAMTPLAAEHWALWPPGFSICGMWASEHWLTSCGKRACSPQMWDLPGPGKRQGVPCIARQIVNHWTTKVHLSFQVRVFSRYMPRSGIAGSYGNSM